MREKKQRSRGAGRNVVLVAAALAALVAAGFWMRAGATSLWSQQPLPGTESSGASIEEGRKC